MNSERLRPSAPAARSMSVFCFRVARRLMISCRAMVFPWGRHNSPRVYNDYTLSTQRVHSLLPAIGDHQHFHVVRQSDNLVDQVAAREQIQLAVVRAGQKDLRDLVDAREFGERLRD